MEFQFPLNLEQISQVRNVDELKDILEGQKRQYNLTGIRLHYLRRLRYIYVKCMDCECKLRYRYQQQKQRYQLTSILSNHNHLNYKFKHKNEILLFIEKLPLQIHQKVAKRLVKNQFRVSDSTFYYYYKKAREPKQTIDQILRSLDEDGAFVHIDPYDQHKYSDYPEMIIIVTPEMKSLFKKYYHFLSLDFTFNLVRQNHPNGKSYKAGYVIGSSLSLKITPFAIVIILEQSKQTYYRIFKSFGQIMGLMPNIIYTDDTLGAKYGVKDLIIDRQFEGMHGLDLFHVLKNIRKRLSTKSNIKYFSQLASAKYHEQFESKYQEIIGLIQQEDIEQLNQFIKNADQYCFSQFPNGKLIGFSSTTGSSEKSHDLLKQFLPLSKPLPVVLKKMIQHSKQLILNCQNIKIESTRIENFFNNNHIKSVRLELDIKIFKYFCDQLCKVVLAQLQEISEQEIIINDTSLNKSFYLRPNDREGITIYQCDCGFRTKVGLPCHHELKYLLMKKISITPYLQNRWRISMMLQHKVKQQRVNPRKTRRRY